MVSSTLPTEFAPMHAPILGEWTAHSGLSVRFRAICPDDEALLVDFHRGLSERSVYYRYFQAMSYDHRVSHDRLAKVCNFDRDHDLVMVADHIHPMTGRHEIIAVARLMELDERNGHRRAEFAAIVSDRYQRHGLGTEMVRRLIDFARDQGVQKVIAQMLPDNVDMQRLCERLGLDMHWSMADNVVTASVELGPQS